METIFLIGFALIFVFSGISAFTSVLALIFKKTRLYKTQKLDALNKELGLAQAKLNSLKDAFNKADDGLKLIIKPMLDEAQASVNTLKENIDKVEHKKKFR